MEDTVKNILGKQFDCLDKGFVRLVDIMGDDSAIVQAARVSYGKGTKSVRMDRELIRYLLRHRHTSPFEMVELKFHIKLPIFIARQWIRHRTANVNEYSGRYSEMKDEFYIPELSQVRTQSKSNRQGRSDDTLPESEAQKVIESMDNIHKNLFSEYKNLLDSDISREIARINLPLSTYTEWYWKIDLHNLMHFLKLRMDDHAQYEIQVYANTIAEILKIAVPMTWEAFEDYLWNGANFSNNELKIISNLIGNNQPDDALIEECGLKGLEAEEFKVKFQRFIGATK